MIVEAFCLEGSFLGVESPCLAEATMAAERNVKEAAADAET